MTRILFTITLCIVFQQGFGQEITNNFGYQNKWEYFVLDDTISGTIIEYNRAAVDCGVLATASVTIIQTTDQDTIRVISLCNTSDRFKTGQIIRISPATRPSFGVTLPFKLTKIEKTEQWETNFYDLQIFRTTYGGLLD